MIISIALSSHLFLIGHLSCQYLINLVQGLLLSSIHFLLWNRECGAASAILLFLEMGKYGSTAAFSPPSQSSYTLLHVSPFSMCYFSSLCVRLPDNACRPCLTVAILVSILVQLLALGPSIISFNYKMRWQNHCFPWNMVTR